MNGKEAGKRRGARPLLLAGAVVLLDQASKWIIAAALPRGGSVAVAGGFLRLTHVQNPGGAFGLFRESGAAFTILSVVAVVFLVWCARRDVRGSATVRLSIGLVLGGAVGNLVDRLRMGRVVDFLDLGIGDLRWPVFNLADVAVVVGVGLFLLSTMRTGDSRGEGRARRAGEEGAEGSARGGGGPA